MHKLLRSVLIGLSVFGVAATFAILFSVAPARAQFNSGDGGGCAGVRKTNIYNRWCAVYGAGWYLYGVNGAGPEAGFRDTGVTWSGVSQYCKDVGADTVVTYVIRNGKYGTWKSYNYGKNGTTNDQSGTGWITNEDAATRFASRLGNSGSNWGTDVGWFCYSDQSHWDVTPYTGIKKANTAAVNADSGWNTGTISATPGETLYWKHTLQAKDARIDKRVEWKVEGSGFPGSFAINNTGAIDRSSNVSAGSVFANAGQYPGGTASYTVFTVGQAQVGGTLCQDIAWNPRSWSVGGWAASSSACADVPYNYTLNPTVNSSIPGTAAAGSQISSVSGIIDNTGPTKSRDNTIWQMTMFTVGPEPAAVPGATPTGTGTSSGTAPCATAPLGDARYNGNYFGAKCQSINRGGGSVPTTDTAVSASNIIIDSSLPVGSRVCFALSVRDRSSSDANWQHSEPRCLVIAKRPKTQVIGSDLIVGRGYDSTGSKISANVMTTTTTLTAENKTYGSWSQYGIIPSGRVVGMSSAAGFVGGSDSADLCSSLSLLTFANVKAGSSTCDTANIGQYSLASPSPVDAIATRFATSSARALSGDVDIASLPKRAIYTDLGDGSVVSIHSSADMKSGEWLVINAPTSTVRITGNLQYTTDPITGAENTPQLIIIAKNISIAQDVTRVDAWLLARGSGANGSINTCDTIENAKPSEGALSAGKCGNQLRVNGPVMANHLYMYRTAGAGPGTQSGDPAEVFNLRPDAYLWFSYFQGSQAKASTVITKELPPRF